MKAAPVLAVALLMAACASVSPIPIRAGDTCFHCRRTIVDTSLAAEVISDQGHAFKFSSVVCLSEYLREHPEEGVKAVFVTDHARGRMLPAKNAYYVRFISDPQIGEVNFAAFRDRDVALEFAGKHKATPVDWEGVQSANLEHGAH